MGSDGDFADGEGIEEAAAMEKERERDNVVAIDFIFENVEVLRFDMDAFGFIDIRDIRQDYHTFLGDRTLCPGYRAYGRVELTIKKEADDHPKYRPSVYEALTPFERLKLFPDVVALELIYSDGTSREIYVPFDGDEISSLQTVYDDEEGNLFLKIEPCPPESEEEDVWCLPDFHGAHAGRFTAPPDHSEDRVEKARKKIEYALHRYAAPDEWYIADMRIEGMVIAVLRCIASEEFRKATSPKEARVLFERMEKQVLALQCERKKLLRLHPLYDKQAIYKRFRRKMLRAFARANKDFTAYIDLDALNKCSGSCLTSTEDTEAIYAAFFKVLLDKGDAAYEDCLVRAFPKARIIEHDHSKGTFGIFFDDEDTGREEDDGDTEREEEP